MKHTLNLLIQHEESQVVFAMKSLNTSNECFTTEFIFEKRCFEQGKTLVTIIILKPHANINDCMSCNWIITTCFTLFQ